MSSRFDTLHRYIVKERAGYGASFGVWDTWQKCFVPDETLSFENAERIANNLNDGKSSPENPYVIKEHRTVSPPLDGESGYDYSGSND